MGFKSYTGNSELATHQKQNATQKEGYKMLKKGDLVVMHTCGEAEYYDGKLWICKTDEQKLHEEHNYTVVWLEGFSGAFKAEYLQKVDITPYLEEMSSLIKRAEFWMDIAERRE